MGVQSKNPLYANFSLQGLAKGLFILCGRSCSQPSAKARRCLRGPASSRGSQPPARFVSLVGAGEAFQGLEGSLAQALGAGTLARWRGYEGGGEESCWPWD